MIIKNKMLKRNKKVSEEQYKGIVKWFSVEKGFGFIVPEKQFKKNNYKKIDLFVHISELEDKINYINEGDNVIFNVEEDKFDKITAVNVKLE